MEYELGFLDSCLTDKVGRNIPERGNSIYNKQHYGLLRKLTREGDLQERVIMRVEA